MCIINGSKCNVCEYNNRPNSINKMNINRTVLDACDAEYFICTHQYDKILGNIKNDEKLYKLLKNENLLKLPICYYDIAYNLVLEENKKDIREYYTNVDYLVEYLIWTFGIPNDTDNYLVKKFYEEKEILKTSITEKYKQKNVKVRTGQNLLRKDLTKWIGKCQICGFENEDMLIASHIKKYSDALIDEAIDFDNAFLFCRHHDGLFDKGLITFDDNGKIIISEKINEHDRNLSLMKKIEKIKIEIREEQLQYLKWHRENIFKK